jgi:predicted Zn-dependent protease
VDLTAELARARLLRRTGQAEQALALLEQTSRRHPEAAAVPVMLAETLLELARPAEALQSCMAALQRLPSRELARVCARAAELLGDEATAAELRRRAGAE